MDSVIYTFHMPLFFFLSGLFFIQSIERRGKPGFLLNKVSTLIYPYVIWSLLQGGIEVLLSHYTNSKTEIGEVLSLLSQPRAQFWFLYALFMVFFVVALCYQKAIFNKYLPMLLVITLALNLYNDRLTDLLQVGYVAKYTFFFMLGIGFQRIDNYLNRFINGAMLCGISILFIGLQYLFHSVHGKTYMVAGIENVILATMSIMFIICLSAYLATLNITLLQRLGELSMMIYLMHILAGSGMRIFLSKILHSSDWWLHLSLGVSAGILIPTIAAVFLTHRRFNLLFSWPHRQLSERGSK
ncbi:acyltransferase [Paramixta manurensis]|uniref:Acyltransferase n=2 Tax=Paramixta manurensis TaxID=2740817 RepID=A0A6M8U9L3_9GAMM|nr:acyltransferase [Erwiniaceae bacterium PD-1]